MKLVKKKIFHHLTAAALRRLYIRLYWKIPKIMPPITRPQIIEVELTNKCNMACTHCHRTQMQRKISFMELSVFKRLVDEILTYPIAFLRICGQGEPALHPDFREMMRYASDKSLKLELTTNGSVFDLYSFEEIISWNIDILGISIDGIDKTTYQKIRKGNDFDRLVSNVYDFYSFRNDSKKKSPLICIRNVIFPEYTINQIDRFSNQWVQSADLVTYNTLHTRETTHIGDSINRCKDIFFSAHINCDGGVRKCAHQYLYGQPEMIGNIKELTLVQIWESLGLQSLRWQQYKKNFPPECLLCHETKAKNLNKHDTRNFNKSRNKLITILNKVVNVT